MKEATEFRNRYDAALALPSPKALSAKSKTENSPAKDALARAHELRKFEIENYWKRATYFWAFQLAAFTLFGLIWKETGRSGGLDRSALLLPCALGAISAQVGWLTAKGSKFWQENWESHVDLLEADQEGRLTRTVIMTDGPQYSVSRANQSFMFLLLCGWAMCFAFIEWPQLERFLISQQSWLPMSGLASVMVGVAFASRMRWRGLVYDGKQSSWHAIKPTGFRVWLGGTIQNIFQGLSPSFTRKKQIVIRDTAKGPAIVLEIDQ